MPVGKFTTQMHLHSRHQLLYAEGGALHFFTGDQQFILPARHAAWIPANLAHKVESPSPHLYLRTLYIWRDEGQQKFPEQLTVFPVTPLAREMIVYTQRWSHEDSVSKAEEAFFNAICHLVLDWCRAAMTLVLPTTQHHLLKNITEYLVNNLETELTTANVAREFGVSSRTLMRLFRGQLDMTFQEYLRMARITTALELLSSADASITEVALQVGYQSMSSFSRTFKVYVGKSPSVFRDEVRSTEE
jgi:AraC-like DNA-binding protein